jgi:hypothetical protein
MPEERAGDPLEHGVVYLDRNYGRVLLMRYGPLKEPWLFRRARNDSGWVTVRAVDPMEIPMFIDGEFLRPGEAFAGNPSTIAGLKTAAVHPIPDSKPSVPSTTTGEMTMPKFIDEAKALEIAARYGVPAIRSKLPEEARAEWDANVILDIPDSEVGK